VGLDALVVTQNQVLSFKLIAFFRLARLYNLLRYIKGNEVFLLTGIAAVTIIFGAVGTYFAESGSKDANITSLDDAFWYAIESITTVAYGEFYPTTALGRLISSLLMFAAIGIVWTLGALIASNMIAKRIKEAPVGLLDETKTTIKNRIELKIECGRTGDTHNYDKITSWRYQSRLLGATSIKLKVQFSQITE
ncbi:MAG: ion channel, partial [Candidatus Nitrosopolaris sp.]